MNVFEKFLKLMQDKAKEHRGLAREFSRESSQAKTYRQQLNRLNDTKYHDGKADMANGLMVEYQLMFKKELKPCDLLDHIDDPV